MPRDNDDSPIAARLSLAGTGGGTTPERVREIERAFERNWRQAKKPGAGKRFAAFLPKAEKLSAADSDEASDQIDDRRLSNRHKVIIKG